MRRAIPGLALACLALLTVGCGADDQPEEWTAHLTISVMKNAKSKEKSYVLICPGRTAHDRDVCAALDVVAPRVFQPVPEDRVCTMIYGGPATATIRGTYGDDTELANASFNHRSSHHFIVTRSPNHWCASS